LLRRSGKQSLDVASLAGWVHLFEGGGLQEGKTKDMSGAVATMTM
jgi:hypothetical protein